MTCAAANWIDKQNINVLTQNTYTEQTNTAIQKQNKKYDKTCSRMEWMSNKVENFIK